MGNELVQTKASLMAPIVARVRSVMDARGMSAYKLSKVTGIDYMNVRRLLDGVTADVMYSTLVKVADALEVDVCEIIGGEG